MTQIGPYEYSDEDVERTIALARSLFDLLPGGFPPNPQWPGAAARVALEGALEAHGGGAADDASTVAAIWVQWHVAVEALRAAGTYGKPASGALTGLFSGTGGVPKVALDRVQVGWAGLAGDRHADRRNHGRPWQAVCIWSSEVVADLALQGHPIAPGCAGENLSITGLEWDRVVPGARLRVGDLLVEVSSYAVPCRTNAGWFVDGRFDAMHHRHGPVSRVYATVLEPGEVSFGDAVLLEPPA